MKRFTSAFLVCAIISFSLPALTLAQYEYVPGTSVLMTASCVGDDVVLSIDYSVLEAPPAEFVGWVVERELLGPCTPDVYVTEVMPWPAIGETHLDLTITPLNPFFDAVYRIWALDAAGNETFVAWPQRTNFAHSACMPGPSTVGRFVEVAGYVHFEQCLQWCWWELSFFDATLPDGAAEMAASGQVVNLNGTWERGMHGPYLSSPTLEPSLYPCDPVVSTENTSWGTLKAMYK